MGKIYVCLIVSLEFVYRAKLGKLFFLVGCAKFMESYYLVLVTKRRQIGCICGHAIYAIDESQMISVPHATIQSDVANSKTELRSVSGNFYSPWKFVSLG